MNGRIFFAVQSTFKRRIYFIIRNFFLTVFFSFAYSISGAYQDLNIDFLLDDTTKVQSKKSSKGNREKVFLEIITSTKVYPATYDMYQKDDGEWKLINIVINGVNLGITFRNQFYSLMEKEENNLDLVIEKWAFSL